MNLADFAPLGNHLWQSTLCVPTAWLLTLALRRNRAAVRYWVWLAVSVKFLIPFSWLVNAGGELAWRAGTAIRQPQFSVAIDRISRPFVLPTPPTRLAGVAQAPSHLAEILLLGVWLCGFTIGVICWFRCWWRIRAARRAATPLRLNLPIPVMASSARLEPGVFGIRIPVLLLPEGIAERLPMGQLEAILAHELCHVRRRDNLTAAIHMFVETVFWFHPLVPWIRTRLVEERERACDEEVVRLGSEPQVYAEGILNVCKIYLGSPSLCVSGVTGSNLQKRIQAILKGRVASDLNFAKKAALASAGMAVLMAPIVVGMMNTPAIRTQGRSPAQPATAGRPDAARIGELGKLKVLLKDNPDSVSTRYNHGETRLHAAASRGRRDLAELLVAGKADVNARDNFGDTPLHAAASGGHRNVVELLLASKAGVDLRDNNGQTPLLLAASAGRKDVVGLLLAGKADVDVKDHIGRTPLHLAAAAGYLNVAELLLAGKADVNAREKNGGSPLHYAATTGSLVVAELLLANHADVNAKEDNNGYTPVHFAAATGHMGIAELLRQHGGHE